MEANILTLEITRRIALKTAKDVLMASNVSVNDPHYGIMQYELQFDIYHAIKKVLQLKSE